MGDTTVSRSGVYASSEIPNVEFSRSAITWSAIVAGAVAAATLSLILLALGSGLGFASVSPWSNAGASATAVGVGAGVWFLIVQWLSSAAGGYLAGRLRTKWAALNSHEVFFRDTAHGFLAWGLATLVAAGFLASVLSGATSLGGTVGAGAAQGATKLASSMPAPPTLGSTACSGPPVRRRLPATKMSGPRARASSSAASAAIFSPPTALILPSSSRLAPGSASRMLRSVSTIPLRRRSRRPTPPARLPRPCH